MTMLKSPTLTLLAADLESGRTNARKLVDECLDRIADKSGEGGRAFVHVDVEAAIEAAKAMDRLREVRAAPSRFAGIPISIKDLFDIKGQVTRAGSRALDDSPPAEADAPVVSRLRRAGFILIGRTNMTEFAFSGVGINPHYGTPGNPFDRARIPGGSSSGAPVSVADAFAVVAIGTDTGGSVRVPAALCGVVGFKPTQFRVSRDGAIPLSTTLDSIGPLANSVACCAVADAVLAGEPAVLPARAPIAAFRLGVAKTIFLDDLESPVATAFERACSRLSRAGARLVDLPLTELADYPAITAKGGFSPPEAYAWHADLIARRGAVYDRRVRERIERGRDVSAADYVRLCWQRSALIARIDRATADVDAVLAPTVPLVAPPIAAFAEDADYWRLNGLLLRNTAIVNFLDRCAVTVPIQPPGSAPVGLMVVGRHGDDRHLLRVASAIEAAIAETAIAGGSVRQSHPQR